MKRTIGTALAIGAGSLLGAASRARSARRNTGGAALNRLTAYVIVPVWIGAGFLDYLWHRRTKIETTSGLAEGLIHSLMMAEAAPAVLAPLFFEINAGSIAGIAALASLHELTVLWDLWFTAPRRPIPAGEQVIHTFLESPPFLVAAAAVATHWNQFLALCGRGPERARFEIRRGNSSLSARAHAAIFLAMGLFGALPHADELRRCLRAASAGRIGKDTPACLPTVF